MKPIPIVLSLLIVAGLSACGTLTGIPGHGGGKRFAVEQELVAATVRASAKDLDVSALKGKRVAVYIVGMGDNGVGNLIGGRYSVSALLRGEQVSTPTTNYPVVTTTTTTGSVTAIAENALNGPANTEGDGYRLEGGIGYNGLGAYRTEEIFNPRDAQFMSAVLQESLALRGVQVVDPSSADYDVYITVDVFGTIRSRHDWHLANQESLIAKTALEMTAIDRRTGQVIVSPQTTSFEAEYNEQYILWAGPVQKMKELRRSEPLLADFKDMNSPSEVTRYETPNIPVHASFYKE